MDDLKYLQLATAAIDKAAQVLREFNEEKPCYNCGTSENWEDECVGCKSARLQERREDRDREESW